MRHDKPCFCRGCLRSVMNYQSGKINEFYLLLINYKNTYYYLRPSHTEHGWAHGSNTVYSVIHGLTGTSIELQPCLRMSLYDLDSNVARVSTNKARIYSIKQCLSRFEHDLQTTFIRLFYGSKYGLVRSVTALYD